MARMSPWKWVRIRDSMRSESMPSSAATRRSSPELKAPPAPVSTTTRAPLAGAEVTASRTVSFTWVVSALRVSGRLKVIHRTLGIVSRQDLGHVGR